MLHQSNRLKPLVLVYLSFFSDIFCIIVKIGYNIYILFFPYVILLNKNNQYFVEMINHLVHC